MIVGKTDLLQHPFISLVKLEKVTEKQSFFVTVQALYKSDRGNLAGSSL
jgi:hypothetical protein